MSFKGTITVDEKTFNLIKLKFSFFQPMDAAGKPHANPTGGLINLMIESSRESKLFFSWMIAPDTTKDGEISFVERDNEGVMKTIKFQKAYCVAYEEEFEATGTAPMTTMLTISAKSFSIEEDVVEKSWTDLSMN